MNLLTSSDIASIGVFPGGVGVPPWEEPPSGEADPIATRLKESYMGRLLPMSRFTLDCPDGLHYSEGIHHPDHNDGVWDPSVSVRFGEKKAQAIWIDPSRRPWRQLPAVLAFMTSKDQFVTYQIKLPYARVTRALPDIGLWVGGLRVSNNAGERYCSGTDDYVESTFTLTTEHLGAFWYSQLELEMQHLDQLSRRLWGSVTGYYSQLKVQNKEKVQAAVSVFWQLCEQDFQLLIDACSPGHDTWPLRKQFVRYYYHTFDTNCPRDSVRQMEAWAKNRPYIGDYLVMAKPEKEASIVQ